MRRVYEKFLGSICRIGVVLALAMATACDLHTDFVGDSRTSQVDDTVVRLAFSEGNSTLLAGECNEYQFKAKDLFGNQANVSRDFVVDLSSSSQNPFFSDSSCQSSVNSIVIPAGESQSRFYFRETIAHATTLSLSHGGLLHATKQINVIGGKVSRFEVSGPGSFAAGSCSGPYTVSFFDAYNNATVASGAMTVNLGGGGSGSFHTNGGCGSGVGSVDASPNSGAVQFYYKGSQAESLTLSAARSGVTAGTLSVTVSPGPAVFSSIPLANDAVGGWINAIERTSNLPLVGSPVGSYVSVEYKLVPSGTACEGVASYTNVVPKSNSSDFGSDGNYVVCVKLYGGSGTTAFGSSALINKDTVASVAGISGAPTGTSSAASLNVTVSGSGVSSYLYKIASDCLPTSGYSAVTPVSTLITASLGSDGPKTLCVVGVDAAGNQQATNSATTASWTKDSSAPPVAVNDAAITDRNQPVTISVLANDSDPDGEPLSVDAVTQGANGGGVTISGNNVIYTPPLNFAGSDAFSYRLRDSLGTTASAVVIVTVRETMKVAVLGTGVAPFDDGFQAMVAQLNDSTQYSFNATKVLATQIDTVSELNAYDAIVIGNAGDPSADKFDTPGFAQALADWTLAGHGVVAVGYTVLGAGLSSGAPVNVFKDIMPVDTTAGCSEFNPGFSLVPNSTQHPVTQGVSSFSNLSQTEYSGAGVITTDASVTVLATTTSASLATQATVVIRQPQSGRSVYLGPIYSGSTFFGHTTTALRTGLADKLFEQATAWAAFYSDVKPTIDLDPSQPGIDTSASYSLGAATPVAVAPSLTASAGQGTTLTSAYVFITDHQPQDVLTVQLSGGITASFTSGLLILQGSASEAVYQQVLRSVKFNTTSAVTGLRHLSFSLNNGSRSNNPKPICTLAVTF